MQAILTRLCVLLTLASSAVRCAEGAPAAPQVDKEQVVKGNTAFALDLYAQLRSQKGNLFFSPYSISTALAMTYAGARGETADQMARVLHLSLDQAHVPAAFGAVDRSLLAGDKPKSYQLYTANALWGQKGHPFSPAFLKLIREAYRGELQEADFQSAPEPARQAINAWVEKETRDKIKELFPPGVLDPSTRLVLANAIYFKGDWASPFKKASTKEDKFHISATQDVPARFMHQTAHFNYLEGADFQALEMPYAGKDLSFVAFLPRKLDGLADFERTMTESKLAAWLGKLHQSEVRVSFPKFQMTETLQLQKTLAAMGMPLAFGDQADFSGIDGSHELFISAVLHKAFVDVNEEGTEAAAATGIAIRATAILAKPPEFRADHPFLFLIRDTRSGSILFIGRLTEPAK